MKSKKNIDWYRSTLIELLELLSVGAIQPLIGARIPLTNAAAAHRLVEQSGASGKVVLLCAQT